MAYAIPNYGTLKTEIADELDRDDLTSKLPRFILQVEARVNADCRVPDMETVAEAQAEAETISLPSDFLAMRSIHLEGTPDRPLKALSPNAVPVNYTGTSGTPVAYVQRGKAAIQLVPPPSASTNIRMHYYASVPSMESDTASNWLLLKWPNLYLYGACAAAAAYLDDRAKTDLWGGLFENELARLIEMGKRDRYGSGPLAPSTVTQVWSARC